MPYPQLFGPSTAEGRATTAEGVGLAWQVFGKTRGRFPTLVLCNGLGCATFFWHYMARYFATHTRVLVWDYRGHGDSDAPRSMAELSIEQAADDCATVMDAAGVEGPVVLVGHSMGSQVILEFHRRHRGRVAGLVPLLGTYGKAIHTFFNFSGTRYVFPVAFHLTNWLPAPIRLGTDLVSRAPITLPLAGLTGMLKSGMIRPEDWEAYRANMRTLDPRVFMHMARDLGRHTAEDTLSGIRVPTLVIAGDKDIFTPLHCSRHMHGTIPDSELLVVPNGSHGALVEQPELINLRLEKFIQERVLRHHAESATAQQLDELGEARLRSR
jgi:pimeloyl-ACP methyl ester carboxylesterase